MCVTPYADAGKACRGKADCTGRCLASDDDAGKPVGNPAAGKCQADNALFGCHAEIVDGKLTPRICID